MAAVDGLRSSRSSADPRPRDLHSDSRHLDESNRDPRWQCLPFDQVPAVSLYRMLELRSRVFVVEQQCFYQDMDGADLDALMVIGVREPDAAVVATARILPPGQRFDEPSIGRVCIDSGCRGRGWGRKLMTFAIACTRERHPGRAIRISAQAHLQRFYETLGFAAISAPYLEDGIPHLEMRLAAG